MGPSVTNMEKFYVFGCSVCSIFFGIKPSDNNELTHASDLAELGLAEELRMFFSGQEVVVLLGPIFRKPGGQQGHM